MWSPLPVLVKGKGITVIQPKSDKCTDMFLYICLRQDILDVSNIAYVKKADREVYSVWEVKDIQFKGDCEISCNFLQTLRLGQVSVFSWPKLLDREWLSPPP